MLDDLKKTDPRIYWDILWRHKWIVVVTSFVVSIFGLYLVLKTPPVYQASCTILLREIDLEARTVERFAPEVKALNDLGTLRAKILSPEILVPLIDQAKLKNDSLIIRLAKKVHRDNPEISIDEIKEALLLEKLKDKILKIRPNGVNMIQIAAEQKDPEMAYKIVKILAEIFIEQSRRTELSGLESGLAFSSEQMNIYKKRLQEAEARLQEFRAGTAVQQFEKIQIKDDHVEALRAIGFATTAQLEREKMTLDAANTHPAIKNTNPPIVSSPLLDQLYRQQGEKLGQLANLLTNNSSNEGEITRINSDIKDLDTAMQSELQRLLASQTGAFDRQHWFEREITRLRIRFLEEKKATIDGALQTYIKLRKTSMETAPLQEMTEQRLKTEAEQARELYYIFLRQTQGSKIQAALQNAQSAFQYRIIEPARRPLSAMSMGRRYKLLIIGILGLGLGVALVFGVEYLDRSLKTVEEVSQYTHAPVVGLMPKLQGKDFDFHLDVKDTIEIQRVTAKLTKHFPLGNLMADQSPPDKQTTVLVTSSVVGEGKSTFAAHLAASVSMLKRWPVLLIDADLRRPFQHQLFKIENRIGLGDLVENNGSAVQSTLVATNYRRLFILPSGHPQGSPLDLFNSRQFAAILEQLKKYFAFIVIDSPPVVPVNDALILSQHVGSVLYVVKAGATSREVVKLGVELVRHSGGPAPGIIVNNLKGVLPYYYSQDYYKYEYSYKQPA